MVLVFVTCQKATLVESESGQLEGRNSMEEPTDTITVSGDFEADKGILDQVQVITHFLLSSRPHSYFKTL